MGKLRVTSFVFFLDFRPNDNMQRFTSARSINPRPKVVSHLPHLVREYGVHSATLVARLLPTLGKVKERKMRRYAKKMFEQGFKKKKKKTFIMIWSMTGCRSLRLRGSQLPRAAGNVVSPGDDPSVPRANESRLSQSLHFM